MSPEFRSFAARIGGNYDTMINSLMSDDLLPVQMAHYAENYKALEHLPHGFIAVRGRMTVELYDAMSLLAKHVHNSWVQCVVHVHVHVTCI